ncbi:pyridoxal phosphate-dependent aminotransferase, partial [Anaerostipes caccae]|nr:pyridoxal phosphate-dependent aminotransferase [Anaerostipes caccae]
MLSKKVLELSKQHSVIRDIFEFGMERAIEVGAENVFDFSIGTDGFPIL